MDDPDDIPADNGETLALRLKEASAPTPFLTRQALTAHYAHSVLSGINRELIKDSGSKQPDEVLATVAAAIEATGQAAAAIHAIAPELPIALRGETNARVEFVFEDAAENPVVRLVFHKDDRIVGQLALSASAPFGAVDQIISGFMNANL